MGEGAPRDPTLAKGAPYNIEQFRGQLAGIFHAMRDYHHGHPDRKVLIFVHGGLNKFDQSLASADNEIEPIMDAGYYPIFLDWNSDLADAYGEHLTRITQGQTDTSCARKLLSPAYLVADMGRALTRAPIVWSNQFSADWAASQDRTEQNKGSVAASNPTTQSTRRGVFRTTNSREAGTLGVLYQDLRNDQGRDQRDPAHGAIKIYLGSNHDIDWHHSASLAVGYVLTLCAKIGLSPLIDWMGTPAWENMSRRTLMAFDGQHAGNPRDPDFKPMTFAMNRIVGGKWREQRPDKAVDFDTTGAFEVFREQFLNVIEGGMTSCAPIKSPSSATAWGRPCSTNGCAAMCWIREYSYANIVYMAAACSVHNFRRGAVPYMLVHSETQFHSLMLHPLAELRERERFADIPPRGSLLVWLDDFLDNPQTPFDRTMGRWDNIIPAVASIPDEVRGRMSLKAFALAPYDDSWPPPNQPDYGPQTHGQFRDRPYWLPEFWYSESDVISHP